MSSVFGLDEAASKGSTTMYKALFILWMAILLVIQPHAVAAQTTGPGDRMLVAIANDSPSNYNCPRNDSGQCLMPLLPETGGDLSALVVDRSAEIAGRATHGANVADYYDETGTSFVVILAGAGLGLCILAALIWRQHQHSSTHTSGWVRRRVRGD